MASKRIKSVKPVKPKIRPKAKREIEKAQEANKEVPKSDRVMQDFLQRLQEVKKLYEINQIAINLLVPSAKVESWLKGNDRPKKTIVPVLNNVLQYLLRSYEKAPRGEAEEA